METSAVSASIEHVLLTVIVQLVVIMASARFCGFLFRRLGQPSVCGEIAAGLILGPSVLGRFFPEMSHRIFDPSVNQVFAIISQLGLVFLMFLIGMEFDFGHLRENRRTALSISGVGILLPFALGMVLGRYMHAALGLSGSPLNFSLFMATAMSITAIPILGRIMIELNLNRTRLGSITISAAAVDDASGWIILSLVTAFVRSSVNPFKLGLMMAEVVGYALFMFLIVRPRVCKWAEEQVRKNHGELSLNALAILLIMVFVSAAITNLIGIFSIFGGFAMGAILFDRAEVREAIMARLRDFLIVFFLPIFFTYTGLRTDIGNMQGWMLWGFCGLVFLAATVGKFGGCMIAAKANGLPWRESAMVGVMMNTRALMELIVINIGYDLGIIPRTVFFMLVFMAVTTTYITTPILSRLIHHSEVEADYMQSAFVLSNRRFAPESAASS